MYRLSAGGNKAVTWGGLNGVNLQAPYYDDDGARSVRLLDPCDDDDNCQWAVNPGGALLQAKRWYPTLETLEDGSIIVVRPAHVGQSRAPSNSCLLDRRLH